MKKSGLAKEKEFKKFLEILKNLKMNLPLVEALAHMPNYAKFLKELVATKRKLDEIWEVTISIDSSELINELPRKPEDPGRFHIPISIGKVCILEALIDIGASINLIPLSLF